MGFDVGEWTVRVLSEGLPPPPRVLERSQTVPLASWQLGRYGAVLFVRRWRNDQIDTDCAITSLGEDGTWLEPWGWSGGGWVDEPLHRPATGWGGEPVVWMGSTSTEFEDDEGNSVAIRAVQGVAAQSVAAIEVTQGDDRYVYRVTAPGGAFVIGIVNEVATLTARTESGDVVTGPTGEPVVSVENPRQSVAGWDHRNHNPDPDLADTMTVAQALAAPPGTFVNIRGTLLQLEGQPGLLCDDIERGDDDEPPRPIGGVVPLPQPNGPLSWTPGSLGVATMIVVTAGIIRDGVLVPSPQDDKGNVVSRAGGSRLWT